MRVTVDHELSSIGQRGDELGCEVGTLTLGQVSSPRKHFSQRSHYRARARLTASERREHPRRDQQVLVSLAIAKCKVLLLM